MLPNDRVVEVLPDGSFRDIPDNTDWERLRNMTEEEIEANALSYPDNPPLTDEELKRMRPIPNPTRIREGLGMSQLEFAETFEVPLKTLESWETSWLLLDSTVMTLLRLIEQDPEGAKTALKKSYQMTR